MKAYIKGSLISIRRRLIALWEVVTLWEGAMPAILLIFKKTVAGMAPSHKRTSSYKGIKKGHQ